MPHCMVGGSVHVVNVCDYLPEGAESGACRARNIYMLDTDTDTYFPAGDGVQLEYTTTM